ncbi:putative ribonuclease H protein [Sesamum angolense]|uniref:Ribonuclease H protein n=1 Tax=Sesamum angolense TaxID=2727404 RepID=A0AAE1XH80_9LAMI|nr:putative ribonuclease H protein [Sesamum angolense]
MGFIFRRQVPRAPSILRWHALSPSGFKLNTDGSSLGNPGLAGAAGIIRDSAGHVHLAYQFALGTGTSVLAELTAVWRGMELALTHGLAPLVVEVDATTVISLLQYRASGKWEVQHMIMRIICLQQLLVADVQHVFREANGAADHLAKEAASLQLTRVLHHDDIMGILRGILCLDRQGVPHLRRE